MEQKNKSQNKFTTWLNNRSGIVLLFAIVLVLANLVSSRAFKRYDITSPKSYSLSDSSRELVKTLDEPVFIQVFFNDKLPSQYSNVRQYVSDILSEYRTAGNGNFSYEFFDMQKDENVRLAASYGIQQIQIREIKNNEVGFTNAFMGMVISYQDQIEVIDAITSSDGLEYKITNAISKVISSTNALATLHGGVKVTLFNSSILSKLQINGYRDIETVVMAAVNSLNKKYENTITYEKVDPPAEDVLSLQEQYGVPVFPLQENGGPVENATMAVVMEGGNQSKCIDLQIGQTINLTAGQLEYTMIGLDTLEDDMEKNLLSLASNVSSIAYSVGHEELDTFSSEDGAALFGQLIQDSYNFVTVELAEDDLPLDIKSLVINGPHGHFTDEELYKIDQFLMRGGNLILLLDPFIQQQSQDMYSMPEYDPIDTGLQKLLDKYGIKVNNDYVMDLKCASSQDQWTGRQTDIYFAPMLESGSLNQKHPITKNLGYVLTYMAASIDVSGTADKKDQTTTILASSSDKAWTVSDNIILYPDYITPPDESEMSKKNIAVLVEGKFDSAFSAKPVSEESDRAFDQSSHLSHSTQNGKVLVISTSTITSSFLQQEAFQNTSIFLRNAIDYMNGNEDVCTMRTKGLSLNTLTKNKGKLVNFVKYFNQFGLAAIVAIIFGIVFLVRQKHRNKIRMEYDSDDSREETKNKKEAKK
ncbi:MAG: GldG family protein [Treponema sp.]|nr:GldG family protein [Treponema sp.]MBR7079456.1 GldG family protein [Treponema sp.]